jgi:hypothetical protein
MAQVDTKTPRGKAARARKDETLPFSKTNYLIFLAGLAAIIFGYVDLARGGITIAPILLVVGYCVIVPIAILYRGRDSADQPSQDSAS